MSDHIKNINPWAEKLEQVYTPDAGEQWQEMNALLNSEMPIEKRRKPAFWYWLIIALLLICILFFGVLLLKNNRQKNELLNDRKRYDSTAMNSSSPTLSKAKHARLSKTEPNHIQNKDISIVPDHSKTNDALIKMKPAISKKTERQGDNGIDPSKQNDAKKIVMADTNLNRKKTYIISDKEKITDRGSIGSIKQKNRTNYLTDHKKKNGPARVDGSSNTFTNKQSGHENASAPNIIENINSGDKKIIERKITTHARNTIDTVKVKSTDEDEDFKTSSTGSDNKKHVISSQNDSNANKFILPTVDSSLLVKQDILKTPDSTNKINGVDNLTKQVAIKKIDSARSKKHTGISLAAGIGLYEHLGISAQKRSNLDVSGGNNIWTDYIPVPALRAYFNKKLYVQIEAEINSPQFTKNLPAKSKVAIDSINSPSVFTSQDSGEINKLYYLNIPVTVHYSPFKNFYIGAGLQFSRVTGAVGVLQNRSDSSTNGNSTYLFTSTKTDNLKNTSLFDVLKRNEWRFLFEANYQWKNLELGARYDHATGNFIDVQISGTNRTQSQNSSLQFYVRYIFWRDRKTKKLFSPKRLH